MTFSLSRARMMYFSRMSGRRGASIPWIEPSRFGDAELASL